MSRKNKRNKMNSFKSKIKSLISKRNILLTFLFLSLSNVSTAQWQDTNGPSGGNVVYSLAISGTNIFAGTWNGVFLSTDNGNSWTAMNTGIPPNTYIFSLAVSGTNIFAGTDGSGIFLSTNNGNSWVAMNTGLTNLTVRALAVSGNNIFAGTQGDGVFISSNNGGSWSAVNSGFPTLDIRSFAVSGTNIFAGTFYSGVFLTQTNGNNWTGINNGLPSYTYVPSLAINGTNIFAGTYNGLFVSSNNGSSWTKLNNGMSDTLFTSIATIGSNIFAGTYDGGVFLSTNNANSWTIENTGLTTSGHYVHAFAVTETDIFVGTETNVFKRSLSDFGIVGIEESQQDINFILYPNPAESTLNIQVTSAKPKQKIEITDMLGHGIYTSTINEKINVDISDFASGVYFVKLYDKSTVGIKRFIKQ
jgi:ligand-binding sensor domain-containing protein